MASGRFINQSLAHSDQFADLANDTHRMLFCVILPHLDRDGRIHGDPRRLVAIVCPMLEVPVDVLERAVADMQRVELAIAYVDDDGQQALAFPGFTRQQPGKSWYSKEKPSRFGKPPESSGSLRKPPPKGREGKGREMEDKRREPRAKQPARYVPDDWMPNQKHRDQAATFGLDLAHEVTKLRAWGAVNKRGNWDRVLTTWLNRAADDAKQRAGDRAERYHKAETAEPLPSIFGTGDKR